MPFVFLDKKLEIAFNNIKNNTDVSLIIKSIESKTFIITVQYGADHVYTSYTDINIKKLDATRIFINSVADDTVSKSKYGPHVTMNDEISLTHEIGHIGYEVLKIDKKIDPNFGRPRDVSPVVYDEACGEAYARRAQNYMMPLNQRVRILDSPDPHGAVRGTLAEIGNWVKGRK